MEEEGGGVKKWKVHHHIIMKTCTSSIEGDTKGAHSPTPLPPSTSSSTSPSPSPLKSRATDEGHTGILWTMKGSPLTSAIKVVAHLSARSAHYVNHIPLFSTVTMYIRLLCHGYIPNFKVTAPILKISQQQFIFDSFNIARYIDNNRISKTETLFPSCHIHLIQQFNQDAQILLSYTRGKLFNNLKHDMKSAEIIFAPRFLRGKSYLTYPLIKLIIVFMQWKYRKECKVASIQETRRVLLDIRSALVAYSGSDLRYLVGDRLTYADIIVAQCISFDVERYRKFMHLYSDAQLANEFPDVIAWARAVRETHCNHTRTKTV